MFKAIILLISLLAIMSFAKAIDKNLLPEPTYRAFSPACEEYGKKHVSRWDLDSADELHRLMDDCRGNGDGSCIRTITAPLSKWKYDSLEEFTDLARSCRGSNNACVLWIKSKLSTFEFNDAIEVKEVASACFATDMRCLQTLCAADHWQCDDKNDYLTIARNCSSPSKIVK